MCFKKPRTYQRFHFVDHTHELECNTLCTLLMKTASDGSENAYFYSLGFHVVFYLRNPPNFTQHFALSTQHPTFSLPTSSSKSSHFNPLLLTFHPIFLIPQSAVYCVYISNAVLLSVSLMFCPLRNKWGWNVFVTWRV